MKGDFSRFTHDPSKHYTGVLKQQGRVDLDADWNEYVEIQDHLRRALETDLMGGTGVPDKAGGFYISWDTSNEELVVSADESADPSRPSRIYVDSILCELESTQVPFEKTNDNVVRVQNLIVDSRKFEEDQWVELIAEGSAETELVQIEDVDPATKELTLTSDVEDDFTHLRRVTTYSSQPHYPGPDALNPTPGRIDLVYLDVWQRHVTAVEDPDIREEALAGPDTTTRLQTVWQVKVRNIPNLNSLPATCSPDVLPDDWPPAELGGGQLSTGGSYRGSDNRLYRVEIHDSGKAADGSATFKWSRDNGTVVFPIIPIDEATSTPQKDKVRVSRLGRDQTLALRGGDWVEVGGDESELNGEAGLIAKIEEDGIDRTRLELTLESVDVTPFAGERHPKVRRWDQTEAGNGTFDPENGACKVEEGKWIELEDGVQIYFEPGNPDHEYVRGDYWIFAVRAATSKVEELTKAPPQGIRHHYCPLALVGWGGSAGSPTADIRDCRIRFGSLSGQLATVESFFYLGGDGQQALPGKEVLQPLRVGLTKGGQPLDDRQIRFTIESGNGRLRKIDSGFVAPFNSVTIETQAGVAECAWELDTVTQGQRVRATVVGGSQAPVIFIATLSGWSVAGTPGTNPVNNFFTTDGKVGIGTSPGHKLHVHTTAGTGNAEVLGVHSSLVGTGVGFKFGMSSEVSGSGPKWGGQFLAIDAGGFPTYGVQGIARGDGAGSKTGIYGFTSGSSAKRAGLFTAVTESGSASTHGIEVSASGAGTGPKFGIDSSVEGDGEKFAGRFSAVSTSGNQATRGVNVSADGRGGTGFVNAVNALAFGSGAGMKIGVNSFVEGGGTKMGGRFTADSSGTGEAWGIVSGARGADTFLKTAVEGNATGAGVVRGGVFTAEGTGTNDAYGIFCSAFGSGGGPKYALFATQGGNLNSIRYAGYFNGNVHVAGTLSKAAGQFLIDHPEDPYNKTLRHNFVESPENLCLYRGKVKLDANGKATVRMPNYFAALTKEDEATVCLTPIGEEPSPTSYKWEEAHTSLTVFGSARAEVAYLVLADRDDPAIRLLSRPAEEEKGEGNFEKGKLLNPEAFGEPEEMGVAPQPPLPIREEPPQPEPLVLEVPDEIGPGGLGPQGEPLGPKVTERKPRRRRGRSSR